MANLKFEISVDVKKLVREIESNLFVLIQEDFEQLDEVLNISGISGSEEK